MCPRCGSAAVEEVDEDEIEGETDLICCDCDHEWPEPVDDNDDEE